MNIGILTHHYVSNYGAFLQAYCLRTAVAALLPEADVRIIDLVNRKHHIINSGGFLRIYPGRETLCAWREKNRLPRVFARARKHELVMTRRVYTPAQVRTLRLDAVIVGSDEVWNYHDRKSFAKIKFGCGLGDARLVAYAASVGGVTAFVDFPPELASGLKTFFRIAARDDNTARLIEEKLGYAPARVLDPTFLAPVPRADTARVRELTGKPYILFYHCAPLPARVRAEIRAYADKTGRRLLGAGEYDTLYDERSIDITPFEWAELFRRADYVVTGTFHGAVFSLLNEKPFSVCPNNPTRAQKLASLLAAFLLDGRIVAPEALDICAQADIDYAPVRAIVGERVRESKAFLLNALRG